MQKVNAREEELKAFRALKHYAEKHMETSENHWIESVVMNSDEIIDDLLNQDLNLFYAGYLIQLYFEDTEYELLAMSIYRTLEQANRRVVEGSFQEVFDKIDSWRRSEEAYILANKRHAPLNTKKEQIQQEYTENKTKYKTKKSFVKMIKSREPNIGVETETIQRWLTGLNAVCARRQQTMRAQTTSYAAAQAFNKTLVSQKIKIGY